MLIAETHPEGFVIAGLAFGALIVYGLVHLYLMCNHPETWNKLNQRNHEIEMESRQARREAAARRHDRNKGIIAALFKGFFGGK